MVTAIAALTSLNDRARPPLQGGRSSAPKHGSQRSTIWPVRQVRCGRNERCVCLPHTAWQSRRSSLSLPSSFLCVRHFQPRNLFKSPGRIAVGRPSADRSRLSQRRQACGGCVECEGGVLGRQIIIAAEDDANRRRASTNRRCSRLGCGSGRGCSGRPLGLCRIALAGCCGKRLQEAHLRPSKDHEVTIGFLIHSDRTEGDG
jgi:hypothetical protein